MNYIVETYIHGRKKENKAKATNKCQHLLSSQKVLTTICTYDLVHWLRATQLLIVIQTRYVIQKKNYLPTKRLERLGAVTSK
jgi:hypothetical protein